MLAQSTPNLVLPKKSDDVIQWNISELLAGGRSNLGYNELAVFVANIAGENSPVPVQGRFSENADYLTFTPYYPFEKGLTYRVRTKLPDTSMYVYNEFTLEADKVAEVAELLHIYPSGEELPENLLRFYFYFKTPMKKEEALKHIHLIDARGKIDEHAFMEFKQELWSPDGKRLTLLFDPGRIKRGVSTNLELGPALLEGNSYQLVISSEWQDVYGQKLGKSVTKTIRVGTAYRTTINISSWNTYTPEAESTQPLTIQFDRMMDHTLIQSLIQIKDEEDQYIEGSWEISESESALRFIPSERWRTGNYEILLDRELEDVAGNNLNGLLDQLETDQSTIRKSNFSIKFGIH
jgi:hypothetical protein